MAKEQNEEGGLQYESSESEDDVYDEHARAKKIVGEHEHKRDYNEVFPGVFKSEKDIVYGPSVAKLRGDDLHIMERLVKKYGDDLDKMVRDIKINYMQWSLSEVKKKHEAFHAYKYEKQT